MTKLSSRGNESGQKKLAHYCFFTLLTRLTRDSYATSRGGRSKADEDRGKNFYFLNSMSYLNLGQTAEIYTLSLRSNGPV